MIAGAPAQYPWMKVVDVIDGDYYLVDRRRNLYKLPGGHGLYNMQIWGIGNEIPASGTQRVT